MILAKDCRRSESSDYAGSLTPAQLHPTFQSQLLCRRIEIHKSGRRNPASALKESSPTKLLNDRTSAILRAPAVDPRSFAPTLKPSYTQPCPRIAKRKSSFASTTSSP